MFGTVWKRSQNQTHQEGDDAFFQPGMEATPGWLPARVPGAVVDDLFRAGEVPDPRYGRNSRAIEWAAERSWVYRCAVELPEIADDEDAVLECPTPT